MNKQSFGRFCITMLISIFLLASCSGVETGDIQSDKTSINIQEEKSLDVSVRLGAGDLTLQGGTSKVAEAEFTYNVEKLKPVVDYQIKDQTGQLAVNQSNMNVPVGKIEGLVYKADMLVNESLPTKLYVKTGAGTNLLNLSNLNLQGAEIYSGVGQTTINMDGDYKKGFEAKIESGVGNTKVIAPKNVGVEIFVDSGVGQVETSGLITKDKGLYVNEAFEKAKVKIKMNIKMGVGDLQIVEGE